MRPDQRGSVTFGLKKGTDLVPRVDDDMRAAKEPGNGARMCVKEPLLDLGYTITAPVDLSELW